MNWNDLVTAFKEFIALYTSGGSPIMGLIVVMAVILIVLRGAEFAVRQTSALTRPSDEAISPEAYEAAKRERDDYYDHQRRIEKAREQIRRGRVARRARQARIHRGR
jgi:hypothetical protein